MFFVKTDLSVSRALWRDIFDYPVESKNRSLLKNHALDLEKLFSAIGIIFGYGGWATSGFKTQQDDV